MIKNVIFDLGNVLISFKPAEYLDKNEYSEEYKVRILTDIFNACEWLQLDNGDITVKEAINRISARSSLTRDEIVHIFNIRTDLMFPLFENATLLPGLKKRGYSLFYLSNFPLDIFPEIKSENHFFKFFDGGIISAEARHSKPNIRIYEILLEKYSLIPEECLFIDDLESNVQAAESIGIKGLVTHGSHKIVREVNDALSITA